VGQITSFLFFMIQILVNFVILGQVLGSIMQIIGASDKLIELLEYEPRIKADEGLEPEETQETKGEISIQNVRFNYPTKADVEVLKGVSFDIPKNKVVALVGTSGKRQ
jgi:ABC-type multidrug transport system fused ATPase/permease subunit